MVLRRNLSLQDERPSLHRTCFGTVSWWHTEGPDLQSYWLDQCPIDCIQQCVCIWCQASRGFYPASWRSLSVSLPLYFRGLYQRDIFSRLFLPPGNYYCLMMSIGKKNITKHSSKQIQYFPMISRSQGPWVTCSAIFPGYLRRNAHEPVGCGEEAPWSRASSVSLQTRGRHK